MGSTKCVFFSSSLSKSFLWASTRWDDDDDDDDNNDDDDEDNNENDAYDDNDDFR